MAHPFLRPRRWLALALLAGLTPWILSPWPLPQAVALQAQGTTVAFVAQPRLIDSRTTRNLASDGGAIYYLTVDVPAAAQVPMDRIVIRLDEGRDPTFRYRLGATQVWQTVGEERRAVTLGEVVEDRAAQTLTLNFDPPLPPGGTVTLALHPVRNPRWAGVYLFGVTAFPAGDVVQPRFMGFARLSFYEQDRHRWP
ncbi:hypothetical protein GFS31_21350 [Leptolyngbya sp. BL0902]|uniref:DUF2808 domain-containing protein n=1 Tax=Leptolyngbya sp. BL0902 TaxID=1115757 RepID=UPI0018E726A9|nr:DUF2808 domain-containing protein [Leptolyngbya sp. BL0902]QQE65447.1 hypothetical protein GFS31_21350 [Leptolyngbya sp. BL0902]